MQPLAVLPSPGKAEHPLLLGDRGKFHYRCSTDDNIVVFLCMDNSVVTMASTNNVVFPPSASKSMVKPRNKTGSFRPAGYVPGIQQRHGRCREDRPECWGMPHFNE
ncbi:hypothetical protein ElyMa_006481100 [Elysia marginata]|uniref:Uncharacterized protein n=1 Tax=Elysia marginata TaxID=1093978 RepID=A0AAV4I5A0_9GAST|nr:hypothetical protein ElyMa_006481100 [Elysia marginata]